MLLFFLRHGDPIYNPDSLTPLGKRQAEALGRRLALYGIDEIYASSSERAKQTAQPTCEMLHKEMQILDWANESHAWRQLACETEDGRYMWAFQQERFQRVFRSPELLAMGDKWPEHPALRGTKLGEGIARIRAEARAFIEKLGYRHLPDTNAYEAIEPNDRRIALFAHQGFGLGFLSCVLDIPYPTFSTTFDMGHSGMTVIEFAGSGNFVAPVALQLANDSHIYREGLPTNYQNRLRF